jgi:pimeloyl-ACP methyl ester carboxylesterase
MHQFLNRRRGLSRRAAGFSLVAAGGGLALAACATRPVEEVPTLPPAVSGERRDTEGRAGRLSYYVDGAGPPLLLIHSINAAGSAFEVQPIYRDLSRDHRVFAPDLPGFGFSDRSNRRYDPELYTAALFDMLDVIAADRGADGPIDALALSLSSEFLARAASREPERFRRLVMVTPTGLDKRSARSRGAPGETREMAWLYSALEGPPWRQGLFDLLVSRRSIRYFLVRTFGSDNVDDALVDYAWRTAHQPGARHAPYAFVSGGLFSTDIRDLYEQLTMPIWVPHGTRGDFKDFSGADWARARDNWLFEALPTGALPHFEMTEVFNEALRGFLADRPSTAQASAPSAPRSPSP